jgi:hypothetical protein
MPDSFSSIRHRRPLRRRRTSSPPSYCVAVVFHSTADLQIGMKFNLLDWCYLCSSSSSTFFYSWSSTSVSFYFSLNFRILKLMDTFFIPILYFYHYSESFSFGSVYSHSNLLMWVIGFFIFLILLCVLCIRI